MIQIRLVIFRKEKICSNSRPRRRRRADEPNEPLTVGSLCACVLAALRHSVCRLSKTQHEPMPGETESDCDAAPDAARASAPWLSYPEALVASEKRKPAESPALRPRNRAHAAAPSNAGGDGGGHPVRYLGRYLAPLVLGRQRMWLGSGAASAPSRAWGSAPSPPQPRQGPSSSPSASSPCAMSDSVGQMMRKSFGQRATHIKG